ncbi:hypothetical protein CFP56_040747 [Quercus suber]|uniref:Uncharacterized protein n=1 Tax=Quercus suber TaxID=58331 RepID=A0AAW0LLH7_QUESU
MYQVVTDKTKDGNIATSYILYLNMTDNVAIRGCWAIFDEKDWLWFSAMIDWRCCSEVFENEPDVPKNLFQLDHDSI